MGGGDEIINYSNGLLSPTTVCWLWPLFHPIPLQLTESPSSLEHTETLQHLKQVSRNILSKNSHAGKLACVNLYACVWGEKLDNTLRPNMPLEDRMRGWVVCRSVV